MRSLTGLLAATMVLLAGPPSVRAAHFRVESETIGDAYQLVTSDDELVNRRRLHQYLGFGAYDLTGDGSNALSVVTLMRFDADLGLTDEDVARVDVFREHQLSIQTAYVRGQGLFGRLDFKLGRFLHSDPIDYLMMDGLVATVRLPWRLGLELLAGYEADNHVGDLTASQFELDGVRYVEGVHPDGPSTALGAALLFDAPWDTRARIGYRRLFSGEDDEVDQEKIGAALYQHLGPVHLYGTGSFDLYNRLVDRVHAGARWQVTDAWDLEGQYVRLRPTFDADSIFNVFSIQPLNDVNGRVRWHLSDGHRVYAGGMVRLFSVEEGREVVDETVSATGLMAGWYRSWGALGRLGADVSHEGGYGGQRTLFDVGGLWGVDPNVFEVDGRLTAVRFEDALQDQLEAWSFGYQLGGRFLVDRRAALSLMVEHNFNRIHVSQLRVFAVADVDVWFSPESERVQ